MRGDKGVDKNYYRQQFSKNKLCICDLRKSGKGYDGRERNALPSSTGHKSFVLKVSKYLGLYCNHLIYSESNAINRSHVVSTALCYSFERSSGGGLLLLLTSQYSFFSTMTKYNTR